jgi:hypothetical protein
VRGIDAEYEPRGIAGEEVEQDKYDRRGDEEGNEKAEDSTEDVEGHDLENPHPTSP